MHQNTKNWQLKVLKAYTKMKEKTSKRDRRRKLGNSRWTPKVFVKTQPMRDAIRGTTSKFMSLYEGPFLISKIYPQSAYALKDENGRARGKFSKKALKQYKEVKQNELGAGGDKRGGMSYLNVL